MHGWNAKTARQRRDFVGWSRVWLQVQRSHGPSAASAVWREVHAERVAPDVGQVVSLCD